MQLSFRLTCDHIHSLLKLYVNVSFIAASVISTKLCVFTI